jgi:hypothetical protein
MTGVIHENAESRVKSPGTCSQLWRPTAVGAGEMTTSMGNNGLTPPPAVGVARLYAALNAKSRSDALPDRPRRCDDEYANHVVLLSGLHVS